MAAERKIVRANFVLPPGLDLYSAAAWRPKPRANQPKDNKHPAGYLMCGVSTPKTILEQPSLSLNNKRVILTPPDAPWLAKDQVFGVSGVSFEFPAAGATWRDYASTRELITMSLRRARARLGRRRPLAIHYRFMQPVLDMTLLFLGLPLVVTRGNRNPFIAIGVCLAVVSGFMLVVLSCKSASAFRLAAPSLPVVSADVSLRRWP